MKKVNPAPSHTVLDARRLSALLAGAVIVVPIVPEPAPIKPVPVPIFPIEPEPNPW